MIRTIITTENRNLTLKLPKEFVGKKVEVIAFVLEEEALNIEPKTFTVLDIPEGLKEGYKFNRQEANER